ncbi:fumarylacetoacetate hydrolase family protein [Haloglycomyces albus]|uniref:fumarylacetoacetate hydrolase family protein n=1 Tax=Haloglycomyces albus TaxID=526067 RepID=UPI00046D35C1|nr:fumarylacetoacetate hydrolase family protein [Haloglycomyces albus]
MSSWIKGADESLFNSHNLPLGVFSTAEDETPHIGARIGDYVLDLHKAVESGDCQTCPSCTALRDPALNRFLMMGKSVWQTVRAQVVQAVTEPSLEEVAETWMHPLSEVAMHSPLLVTDFVDFNSSEAHAANMGRLRRSGAEVLPAGWRAQPQSYSGRASSVFPSGLELARPMGYRRDQTGVVQYGPTRALDVEAEVGFIVGGESGLGVTLSPDDFSGHVFGAVLLNDWTARDFSVEENIATGPQASKGFATSMSAWVTPLEALDAAISMAPAQDGQAVGHLKESDRFGYDIQLALEINGQVVSRPQFGDNYWTPPQLMSQLTSNGVPVRAGTLFGSGAVSGAVREQCGTLLEMTWAGQEPLRVGNEPRIYLEDGDEVRLTATAPGPQGATIALGEVETVIQPARR